MRAWFPVVLLAVAAAASGASPESFLPPELSAGARVLRRLYEECAERPSTLDCLKGRAAGFLDRAARADSLPLGDFGALVRDPGAPALPLADREVESAVAAGGAELDQLLFDRAARFLDSRSLRLSLPRVSGQEIARGLEEGRKIKDKIQFLVLYAVIVILSLL